MVSLSVAELAQQHIRSLLYDANEFLDLALISISLFTLSLAMVTRRSRLANASLDALLVVDSLKLCLSWHCTKSFTRIILPAALSAIRIGLFLGPTFWCTISSPLKNNLHFTRSIRSLWQSPFRITSAKNVQDLGEEFTSGSLHHRYNQSWSRCK